MVLLQLKDPLELFVKSSESFSRFLVCISLRYDLIPFFLKKGTLNVSKESLVSQIR